VQAHLELVELEPPVARSLRKAASG